MKEEIIQLYLNKVCKIILDVDGKNLIFTGTVKELDNIYISFIDKFGSPYTFSAKCIKELRLKDMGGEQYE